MEKVLYIVSDTVGNNVSNPSGDNLVVPTRPMVVKQAFNSLTFESNGSERSNVTDGQVDETFA